MTPDDTAPRAIGCAGFARDLAEALSSAASPERDRALAHASACEACAALLDETRGLIGELRSVPVPEPGAAYGPDLIRRVEAGVTARRRGTALWRTAGLAAALLLAAVLLTLTRGPSLQGDLTGQTPRADAATREGIGLSGAVDDEFLASLASLAPALSDPIGEAMAADDLPEAAAQDVAGVSPDAAAAGTAAGGLPGTAAGTAAVGSPGTAADTAAEEGEILAIASWHSDEERIDNAIEELSADEARLLVEMLTEEIESRRS